MVRQNSDYKKFIKIKIGNNDLDVYKRQLNGVKLSISRAVFVSSFMVCFLFGARCV